MAKDPRRCIVGTPDKPARSTFMFCRQLKEPEDGEGPATGSSAFLFPKKDKAMHKRVMAAIEAAGKKKFGEKFNIKSRKYSLAIRDGDELFEDEDYSVGEEAKGMWFVSTRCYKVPQLVDSGNERIIDPEEVEEKMRSGNYFLASITFKGFDNESKGVRAELNNLMFVKEGERLDGSASAEQDFEDYAMDGGSDDDDDDDDDDDGDDDDKPSRRSRKSGKSGKSRRRRR